MCEILVLKQNNKNLFFEQSAIQGAIDSNRDGVGYVVFKKNKDKTVDIVEIKHFNKKTTTKTTTQYVYTDYEWEDSTKTIILTTSLGNIMKLKYDKEIQNMKNKPFMEKQRKLETWLTKRNVAHDFNTYIGQEEMYDPVKWNEPISGKCYYGLPIEKESTEKIAKELYQRQMKLQKNEFIIMHFRLATKGNLETNIQPIITDDFITIHNGVFTSLGDETRSDTTEFTQNLEIIYNLAHIKNGKEEEQFIETFLDITAGWYSTFIYSKKRRKLYYFKNGASFFAFADNIMYSTKEIRFPIKSISTSIFE